MEIEQYVSNIKESGLSIYDLIEEGDHKLWIPGRELELLLNKKMKYLSLKCLPNRTRSKFVKTKVCEALGYPVPESFKKTKPQFPGQLFDTYVQKSNNFQVWNEKLEPSRRYVIFQVNDDDKVTKVRVVSGDTLAKLDTTGTLTQKYQAWLEPKDEVNELISCIDTKLLNPFVAGDVELDSESEPNSCPRIGQLMSIKTLFTKLTLVIGQKIEDFGATQERKRAAALQELVCKYLGYSKYHDDGQFPDIRHQLLEIKLQTSPTIDLGLVCPISRKSLGRLQIEDRLVRPCDIRYAIFFAKKTGHYVTLTSLHLTTGEKFFSRFNKSEGKVLNRKLQLSLPANFFNGKTK